MSEEPVGGASEEQYRLLAESIPHPVWVARPDGGTEYWNGRYREYTGASLPEVLDWGWQRVIHPDDLPPTLRAWRNSLHTGSPFYCEHRIRRADGMYRWHSKRAVPLRDGQGRIARWLGTCIDIEEQKQAEEGRRVVECRFRALIEKSFDSFILLAADGTLLYASPSYSRVLGYEPEELVGRDGFDFLHPDDRPEVARLFAWLIQRPRESVGAVHRALHKDGSWRWLQTQGTNLLDDAAVHAVVVNFRDITEQKQSEETRARLAAIVESSEDVILGEALDGTIQTWNPAAQRLYGWSAAEAIGKHISLLTPPERAGEIPQILDRLRRGESIQHYETVRVRKDGRPVNVSLSISPIKDAAGRVVGAAKVARDITQRKKAEEVQARDAMLLANVRDSVIVTDLEGVVTYWNEGATRLFGWTAGEMLGHPLAGRLPEGARAEARDWIHRIREGSEFEGEWQDYRKDGSRVWVHARTSLIKDPTGHPIAIMGLSNDISDRKLLEAQLRQSQKMEAIGQLAGGVAHDFNNLLTVINGYSDLVYKALGPDNPVRDSVDQIRKAGERSASLTRQLLAFSRKQVIVPKVLDLNTVILDLERMLRRVLGEDIDLATSFAPDLGNIRADPGQVEQVLLNLVVNSRDAMPQGGKLTVETRNVHLDEGYAASQAEVRPGRYVLVAVSDTGCGMTPEVKARIFEPFFTTKGPGKGTGLGLATVFGIVKQSGGHVEVYSEPGIGTSFKVYLPVVEGPVRARKSSQGLAPTPRGSETILLVEDDEGVRTLTRHLLRDNGYEVLAARDGEEAIAICRERKGRIDLLVSDVVMPGLGGLHLSERLLGLHPEMKVLFLSGYTDDAVVRQGVFQEEVNFLQKPFTPSSLAQKVREVLDAPKGVPFDATP